MSTPHQPFGNGDAPAPDQSKPNSHHCILVVDDEEQMRQLNSRALILCGYQVDTAEDGEAGWKALQAVSYGLLITDNQMPKVTGVELVKKCRRERMTLPVILASGALPTATESLQLAAILLKPFTEDQLLRTVKAVLQGQMPNNITPKLRRCAQRLLAHEAASAKQVGAKASAASRVCQELRGPLINLAGIDGYRSLLSRALTLAGAEVPWLRPLETKPDGSLEGLEEFAVKLDSRTIAEGERVLMAQFLGLLVTLIGSALTLSLLQSVWPAMDELDF
jgi:two-component system OmpR family response regulator